VTFSYDPTTNIGRVRLRIMDTRPEDQFFSDEELTALIADAGSWRGAVAEAARVLLMRIGRFARNFSNEDGSTDETAAAQYLQALIAEYASQGPILPTVAVSTLGLAPSDRYFRRGV